MNNFCVENILENPKCSALDTYDFLSEEQIFDILLDVLKAELPQRMQMLQDCQGNPMYIAEDDIDLIPSGKDSHFELMLNPLDDQPVYNDSRNFRTVTYRFELILTVHTTNARCITWELIKFKNSVEGLIIATEFHIDGYESVDVEPQGFNYYVPEQAGDIYRRQGSYKFTVTVSQYKIN